MARLYLQPWAHRFGTDIVKEFESETWSKFDAAVAWVRHSGVRHLLPAMQSFLDAGHYIRMVVGVDLGNTSADGLRDLLSLNGSRELFVRHNESGCTYHPKLYLFSNSREALLRVGSNNLTESGLYTNEEIGIVIATDADEPIIQQTVDAVDDLVDTTNGLTLQLTPSH